MKTRAILLLAVWAAIDSCAPAQRSQAEKIVQQQVLAKDIAAAETGLTNLICNCITLKVQNGERNGNKYSHASILNTISRCEKDYLKNSSSGFRNLERLMIEQNPEDSLRTLDWQIYQNVLFKVFSNCRALRGRINDTAAFYDSVYYCRNYGVQSHLEDWFIKKFKDGRIADFQLDFQTLKLYEKYKKSLYRYYTEIQQIVTKNDIKPYYFALGDQSNPDKEYITVSRYDEATDSLVPLYQLALYRIRGRFGKMYKIEQIPLKEVRTETYLTTFPYPSQSVYERPCWEED